MPHASSHALQPPPSLPPCRLAVAAVRPAPAGLGPDTSAAPTTNAFRTV